ncbi:ABC transporter substrate-binding protein [Actinomarinicola tropica]|nr:ABC transporter substrate-binding protein [Actinomarinicola tropica]
MKGTMPTRRRRGWRAAAGVIVAGIVAASCGGDDSGSGGDTGTTADEQAISSTTLASDVEEVTTGGTVVVGLEADANTFLPGAGSTNTNVARAVFDSIAVRGADGEIHPHLAESIEANEGSTEWTVTLRDGITFHDGTPLDAEAVKRNFDEYLNTETSTVAGSITHVQEVRVDGPLTYTYVLSEPDAAFPDLLTGTIGYPFSNEACAAAGQDCGSQPVGAGPFRFVSWQRDSEIRLERNPDYWRTDANGVQLPYLDELIFRPIPDESSRIASVQSGDIQVGHTFRQSFVRQTEELEAEGEIQSLEGLGNNGGGGIFNVLVPPVDDVRVRQALVHATEQEDLIEVLGGAGITPPQTQFFSPNSPWYSAAVEEAYPAFDPARAEELLDEYINDPERSDGKAVGEPVSIRFQCPPDPSLLLLSQTVQAFWNGVGVEVELEQVEQPTLITNALGSADQDPPFSGTYMITCFRMGADQDPYTTLAPAFGPVATSSANVANYTSDNLDEQLQVLQTSSDFEERYAAVESMMMELAEQVPLMWAGGTATSLFATEDVRNLGGWTAGDGAQGDGVTGAVVYWAEVWRER